MHKIKLENVFLARQWLVDKTNSDSPQAKEARETLTVVDEFLRLVLLDGCFKSIIEEQILEKKNA